MVWACDAGGTRENTYENATHKNGGKMTKRKTQNQIRNYIEMRGANSQEIKENKWEKTAGDFPVVVDSDFWKLFLLSSSSSSLLLL